MTSQKRTVSDFISVAAALSVLLSDVTYGTTSIRRCVYEVALFDPCYLVWFVLQCYKKKHSMTGPFVCELQRKSDREEKQIFSGFCLIILNHRFTKIVSIYYLMDQDDQANKKYFTPLKMTISICTTEIRVYAIIHIIQTVNIYSIFNQSKYHLY